MSSRRPGTAGGEHDAETPRAGAAGTAEARAGGDLPRVDGAAAAALPLASAPRPSARGAWQVLDGEAVILDLEGHKLMGLNPTGSFVWGLLDGRRTLAQIAAAVVERFQVSADRAEADVSAFAAVLSQRGLIEI